MYAQRKAREGAKGGKESYKGRPGKVKWQARKSTNKTGKEGCKSRQG
jgi:hypothetical protein